jgi:uncharacterized membrane protein
MGLAMDAGMLYNLGIIIIFLGIIIILVTFVLLFLSSIKGGLRGGGALIIGPIPIVFSSDSESTKAILWLSITLTVLLFVFFIILSLLGR